MGNRSVIHIPVCIAVSAFMLAPLPRVGAQISGGAYVQDALADGVVILEAEAFHASVAASGAQWSVQSNPAASGGAVVVVPDTTPTTQGLRVDTNYAALAPRLDYRIRFNRTGVHYVVLRGLGPNGDDDSCHAGLNGLGSSSSDRFGFTSNFTWRNVNTSGQVRTINVPSVGEHVLNIWLREDGLLLDRILVTTSAIFLPDGVGPASSPREGEVADPARDLRETRIVDMTRAGGALHFSFTPAPGVESYEVRGSDHPATPPAPEPGAVTLGFAGAVPESGGVRILGLHATPVPTDRELASIVLQRLTYGPTPPLVDRVLYGPSAIGAEAFIDEQLAPENLVESADTDTDIQVLAGKLARNAGTIDDLQAWHLLRAVKADRQLLEVLLQFFDNHFVTEYNKSRQYFIDDLGYSSSEASAFAAALEYRELQQWRQVLLNPNGTFLDLLRISLQSPAMLIYLDTVDSDRTAPNENYPRELLELFTMGVDNGYTQRDIEEVSRAITGYRIRLVDAADAGNLAAPPYSPNAHFTRQATDWLYRKGTSAPAANWFLPAYTPDGTWLTGTTSIGYGDGDDSTVLTDMQNSYTTLYFRKTFNVPDPSSLGSATLRIYIDDGYIAYLNGVEIGRHNAGTPGQSFSNTGRATGVVNNGDWTEIVISNPATTLQAGVNLLAVMGLNANSSSSDFSFDAELVAGDPPVWAMVYDETQHDNSAKTNFPARVVNARFGSPYAGVSYQQILPARSGIAGAQDAFDIVDHLANQPQTMEYLAVKLCQLFVHEDFAHGYFLNVSATTPEADLVRACMNAWNTPGPDGRRGNLRLVLRAIFQSDLFRGQLAQGHKVKSPIELVASAIRCQRMPLGGGTFSAGSDGYDLIEPVYRMGMDLFNDFTPDGYPENGNEWIDTGTIAERYRFLQNLMMRDDDALKDVDYGTGGAQNISNPVAILQARLPAGSLTDPVAVTDEFLHILFPGEGRANLDLLRSEGVRLLDSNDTGTPGSSPFSALSASSAEYDLRVRELVGLLLCHPYFMEQ